MPEENKVKIIKSKASVMAIIQRIQMKKKKSLQIPISKEL